MHSNQNVEKPRESEKLKWDDDKSNNKKDKRRIRRLRKFKQENKEEWSESSST